MIDRQTVDFLCQCEPGVFVDWMLEDGYRYVAGEGRNLVGIALERIEWMIVLPVNPADILGILLEAGFIDLEAYEDLWEIQDRDSWLFADSVYQIYDECLMDVCRFLILRDREKIVQFLWDRLKY